jgi:hypothetical protein
MRRASDAGLPLAVLLAIVSTWSCTERSGSDPAASGSVASAVAPEDSALAAFLAAGPIRLGPGRQDIRLRLGTPDSVTFRTVINRHDPEMTDSVFVLHYTGASAEVYRAGYDGKEMLTELEIRDDVFIDSSSELRPGVTAATVRELLGAPTDSADSELRYVCEACLVSGHETVSFLLADGRVRAIRIQYWID